MLYEDENGQPLYGEKLASAIMESYSRLPRLVAEVKKRYKSLYFVSLQSGIDPYWKTMPIKTLQEDGTHRWEMGSIAMLRHRKITRILGIPFCEAELLVGEELVSIKDEDVLRGAVAHELSHLLVDKGSDAAVDADAVKHGFGKELCKTFSYLQNMFDNIPALVEEMEARKTNILRLMERKEQSKTTKVIP